MKILTICFTWNLLIWFIGAKHHRKYNLYFQWFDYWTVSELKSAKNLWIALGDNWCIYVQLGPTKTGLKKNIKKKRKFWRSFHSFRQRNIKIHSDSNIFVSKSINKLLDSNLNLPHIRSFTSKNNKQKILFGFIFTV